MDLFPQNCPTPDETPVAAEAPEASVPAVAPSEWDDDPLGPGPETALCW